MLNFRQIDSRICLSGGWTDVPVDAKWLASQGIEFVLDLQFTPDSYLPENEDFIRVTLWNNKIEYKTILMYDGDNDNIERIFEDSHNILTDWETKFSNRWSKILIKCGVGVSRSPAVLINHLCIRDRLNYGEARWRIASNDNHMVAPPISIDRFFEVYLKTKYPDDKDYEKVFV